MRPVALFCLALLASLLAGAVPAKAEWRRAVSNHFIIYSEASDEGLRAVAERLERFDGLLRRLTPVPAGEAARRLTIYMPRSVAAIEQLVGRPGVGGFYTADATGPFAVAPRLSVERRFRGRCRAVPRIYAPFHAAALLQRPIRPGSSRAMRNCSPTRASSATARSSSAPSPTIAGWRCARRRRRCATSCSGGARGRSRPLLRPCLGAYPLSADLRRAARPASPLCRPGRGGPPGRKSGRRGIRRHRRAGARLPALSRGAPHSDIA